MKCSPSLTCKSNATWRRREGGAPAIAGASHCTLWLNEAVKLETIKVHYADDWLRRRGRATCPSTGLLDRGGQHSSVAFLCLMILLCGSKACFVNCDIFSSTAHIQSLMHMYVWLISAANWLTYR